MSVVLKKKCGYCYTIPNEYAISAVTQMETTPDFDTFSSFEKKMWILLHYTQDYQYCLQTYLRTDWCKVK